MKKFFLKRLEVWKITTLFALSNYKTHNMNTIKSLHRAKNSTLEALHSLSGVDNQELLAKVTVAFTNCLNEYQAEYDRLLSEGKDEYDILIALRDN